MNTLEAKAAYSPTVTSSTDRKLRWAGLLENPYISKFQRNCFDFGRVRGLKKVLSSYSYHSMLDVGCGLGEGTHFNKGTYIGVDNSWPRVFFAASEYRSCTFVSADALKLPFKNNAFDLVSLIQTSHHLSDEMFLKSLDELLRVSRKYVVLEDPIVTENQNRLSAFIYSLDRGACFRSIVATQSLLKKEKRLRLLQTSCFKTFPGLYLHCAFILEKT